MTKKHRNPAVLVIATLVGLYLLKLGVGGWQDARRQLSWPATTGTVFSSKVETYVETVGDKRGRKSYYARLGYSYKAKGKTYKGEFSSNMQERRSAAAKEMVQNNPVGTKLKIFYNPDKPKESTLHRQGAIQNQLFFILLGLLAIGYGVYEFRQSR